jgi:hypothetical protein
MKKMKIKDLAYIAGIIDGEGGFCVSKINNGYRSYICISNTDIKLMKYLQKNLKGSLRVQQRKIHHKPVYRLYLNPNAVRKIIDSLIPYLLVKKEQAILVKKVLNISASVKHRIGHTGSSNIIQRPKLHNLYVKIKKLNQRGLKWQIFSRGSKN